VADSFDVSSTAAPSFPSLPVLGDDSVAARSATRPLSESDAESDDGMPQAVSANTLKISREESRIVDPLH